MSTALAQKGFEDQEDAKCVPFKYEKQVYSALGLEAFRNLYLSTVGKIIEKTSGKKFIEDRSIEGIQATISNTLKLEMMHWVGLVVMAPGIGQDFSEGRIVRGSVFAGVNALVNAYPIMLQRVNRLRMFKILQRKGCNNIQ